MFCSFVEMYPPPAPSPLDTHLLIASLFLLALPLKLLFPCSRVFLFGNTPTFRLFALLAGRNKGGEQGLDPGSK
jgi:hypothetical protein